MKAETMGEGTAQIKKNQKDPMHESKENIAVDSKNESTPRSFGILDMWNLQKRQRSGASLRRRFQ